MTGRDEANVCGAGGGIGMSTRSSGEAWSHLFAVLLAMLLLASVPPFLMLVSYRGSADFHAATEMVGSLLALTVGFAMVARFYSLGRRFYLIVGIAFLVNGAEDLVHGLLVFEAAHPVIGAPASSVERFIPGSYVTGRLLLGFLLLAAPLVDAKCRESSSPKRETFWVTMTAFAATAVATVLAFNVPLPEFVYPQRVISRPVDFASAIVLFLALLLFLREYRRGRDELVWWIALSIAIHTVGQLMMGFSKHLYDPLFDTAHVCKVLGYTAPLVGFSLYQIAAAKDLIRIEAEIRSHRDHLEELVEERTSALVLDETRLEALLQLGRMTDAPLKELTDFALEGAVRLTESKIGYLAFMDEREETLIMYSWSKTAMAECEIIDKPIFYPVETTGLWGETVRQRKPVITNDYGAPNPWKKGQPEGHVRVTRHMNIPVFEGERIVAVAGVGNKEGEYNDADVRQLTLLMNGMWKTLQQRKVEEERKRLLADLESKNAELERFAYTVSHDLKSPLITISGFLGLLRQDVESGNLEGARSDIDRIEHSASKMSRLLTGLLELSRIGRLVNPPESVSFEDLAREAVSLVQGRIESGKIEVTIGSDLPILFGDRQRLSEVVQNLVDNAAKHTAGQPSPRIEIGARRDGDELVCYVRDNGTGIDPEYHEKIFGLFEQVDREVEGTGIGLALVKRIIEVHGGRVWVESEGIGHGTTFCFTLPAENAAEEDVAKEGHDEWSPIGVW